MDTTRHSLLSIGAFASAAGLSLRALRLYDQLGILTAAHTDPESGYRYYSPDQVSAARLIRLMRSMNMPLAQVQAVLTESPAHAEAVVRGFCSAQEQHLVLVRTAAGELLRSLSKETSMTFAVQIKQRPAMQVVSITRQVKVEDLGQHISGSLLRLAEYVQVSGGTLNGTPFGIYHGPVNHTDDGPVEVCFPASGPLSAEEGETEGIEVKHLPPQQTATVRISGEQCRFPEILGAYDAAHDWITGHGGVPDGPPCEIWNGPDEKGLMEIAWPFVEAK